MALSTPPRWLIGLDLHPDNLGPSRLAGWLRSGAPVGALIGVHIVETGLFRFVGERLGPILTAARVNIDEFLAAGASEVKFDHLEAVPAASAEEGLAAASRRLQADALVIGRWSRRTERSLVRLGRVARRLLRDLPLPVIVTPPDLRRSVLGDGPIIVATDLSATSIAACRFAHALASRFGRPLVVHYVGVPIAHAAIYVLDDEWEALAAEERRLVAARVEAWVAAHVPGTPEIVITTGSIVDELLALVTARRAPLLVVGSRRLSLAERIFGSSTASTLASYSDLPVAVVPGVLEDAEPTA